jgi:hypothetical protein
MLASARICRGASGHKATGPSPGECLSDGQSTNCKVNAHVAVAAAGGGRIQVRFVATDRRMEVERQLIAELKPPWNSRGGRYSTAVPPSQGGPISMPMAEDFRRALHNAVFAEGERSGAPSVTVHAGNLHRRIGGYPGSNQGRTQETEIYAR